MLNLCLLVRPIALFLAYNDPEANGDGNPVEVVRDDGSDSGGVLPSQEGVENTPKPASIQVRVAALDSC